MTKQNHYTQFSHQANEIKRQGIPINNPCSHCVSHGIPCIMDLKSRNCAAYTHRGCKYEKYFHSEGEWKRLNCNYNALSAQINETENQIKALFARLKSLKTHRKFLKSYGKKMLDYDTMVLDYLNEEDPLGPQDLQELDYIVNNHKAATLAAMTDDPSLSQLWNDPLLWVNIDFSVHNIAEQVGGSPSSSQ